MNDSHLRLAEMCICERRHTQAHTIIIIWNPIKRWFTHTDRSAHFNLAADEREEGRGGEAEIRQQFNKNENWITHFISLSLYLFAVVGKHKPNFENGIIQHFFLFVFSLVLLRHWSKKSVPQRKIANFDVKEAWRMLLRKELLLLVFFVDLIWKFIVANKQ